MSKNLNLIRARRRYLESLAENGEKYQEKLFQFPAMIGRGDGTVQTGRTGWIYVTDLNGVVHEVINVKVPNTAGRMVRVGNDIYNPHVKQVLALWHAYNTQPAIELPSHSHRWDGEYTDYVEGEQFLPGLIMPILNTMTVKLYPFYLKLTTGGYMLVPNDDIVTVEVDGTHIIDLEPYRPADGALMVTIAAAQDGTITVAEGSLVDSPEVLTDADIPDPVNEDDKELWAVKLYSGQTDIRHRFYSRHLYDLRWGRIGGIGAPDANEVTFTPGDEANWDYPTPPGFVDEGLDQLAARVAALEAVDITDGHFF